MPKGPKQTRARQRESTSQTALWAVKWNVTKLAQVLGTGYWVLGGDWVYVPVPQVHYVWPYKFHLATDRNRSQMAPAAFRCIICHVHSSHLAHTTHTKIWHRIIFWGVKWEDQVYQIQLEAGKVSNFRLASTIGIWANRNKCRKLQSVDELKAFTLLSADMSLKHSNISDGMLFSTDL